MKGGEVFKVGNVFLKWVFSLSWFESQSSTGVHHKGQDYKDAHPTQQAQQKQP